MNDYAALRQKNNGRLPAALILLLCVVLSASMLFSRLMTFTPADTRHYIPLTKGNGLTKVTTSVLNPETAAAPLGMPRTLIAIPRSLSAQHFFQVTDENTVWSTETDIEIFRVSYQNDAAQITVNSQNGDSLLAPGTSNTYEFVLENTGHAPMAYTMEMEAWFSHTEYPIPVVVRLTDKTGDYLLGSEEEAADVLALNEVYREGTVQPGNLVPYTLHWEWPFELDDEYDTMLGNLAVDEDITLTIVIRTTASCTDCSETDKDEEPPKTGDTTDLAFLFALMIGSAAGLLLLVFLPRKKQEERHG